jgi:hypothetical protein
MIHTRQQPTGLSASRIERLLHFLLLHLLLVLLLT